MLCRYDWWDGTVFEGNATLDGYFAPLDKLPLFVKAGSIIPLWPEMNYFDEKPHDPITFEIFPGANFSTTYTLYEVGPSEPWVSLLSRITSKLLMPWCV